MDYQTGDLNRRNKMRLSLRSLFARSVILASSQPQLLIALDKLYIVCVDELSALGHLDVIKSQSLLPVVN